VIFLFLIVQQLLVNMPNMDVLELLVFLQMLYLVVVDGFLILIV